MRSSGFVLTVSWTAVAILGCVEKEGGEKVDDVFIQSNLLSAAPTPQHAVNASLGGKVIYLGADVDKTTAAIGERVKITHYWKVVEAPGAEWRLFTHVNGAAGDWINVDDTKMRKGYGPDQWKAGDIVRDEQVFPIIKSWKSKEAVVYVGMFRKGGQTERDRMPITTGPNDGHGRVEVLHIPIAGSPRPDKGYVVRHTTGPIALDGKADEKDWATAPSTGAFKTVEGGEPVPETRAKLLWDDENLYVFADMTDPDVASQYTKHDEPIWKEDAIELFIDADKSGQGYVELQVNPRNTTFDSWFATVRPNGNEKWDSGMTTAVTVDGTLDDRGDTDRGWHVEAKIPLVAVKGTDDKMAIRLPPRIGDSWKLNIVRVEKPKDKGLTASAWAQIGIGDFHAIDRLMTITFGDDKGMDTPASQPTSAPTAGAASQPASAPTKPAKAAKGKLDK